MTVAASHDQNIIIQKGDITQQYIAIQSYVLFLFQRFRTFFTGNAHKLLLHCESKENPYTLDL